MVVEPRFLRGDVGRPCAPAGTTQQGLFHVKQRACSLSGGLGRSPQPPVDKWGPAVENCAQRAIPDRWITPGRPDSGRSARGQPREPSVLRATTLRRRPGTFRTRAPGDGDVGREGLNLPAPGRPKPPGPPWSVDRPCPTPSESTSGGAHRRRRSRWRAASISSVADDALHRHQRPRGRDQRHRPAEQPLQRAPPPGRSPRRTVVGRAGPRPGPAVRRSGRARGRRPPPRGRWSGAAAAPPASRVGPGARSRAPGPGSPAPEPMSHTVAPSGTARRAPRSSAGAAPRAGAPRGGRSGRGPRRRRPAGGVPLGEAEAVRAPDANAAAAPREAPGAVSRETASAIRPGGRRRTAAARRPRTPRSGRRRPPRRGRPCARTASSGRARPARRTP